MKAILGTVVIALALAATASAGTPAGNSTVVIHHAVKGCHLWAVNNGPFTASQTLTLKRGSVVTFTNMDLMPHTLVLVKGPALTFAPAKMGHMGAFLKVKFTHAGVYTLKTKAGEDYPSAGDVKTIGEDNVLRLVVTVR